MNGSGTNARTTPRGYGRVMLMHEPGAARTEFATVRSVLPSRLMSNVRRTLPVFKETESGLRVIATREITVRFKPRTTQKQHDKVLNSLQLVRDRSSDFMPRQYIVTPAMDVNEHVTIELANLLSECSEVEYAAPNFVSEHRKAVATNDPQLKTQWYLNNTGMDGALQGEDIGAFAAWDITTGGDPKIVIAIVDDGVDINHPDLKSNIWVNPNAAAPDRNGRNFYDDDYDPRPRYFNDPFDDTSTNDIHGTPCAGVAAAVGQNKLGVVGIAYRCKILPVKIFGADELAPNDRVADSIRYSGQHAQIISCSWGCPSSNVDLEAAITDVVDHGRGGKGCMVFYAAGNFSESRISFPAKHPKVFAVGASNDMGKRSTYSNYGKGIAFVAPSNDPSRDRAGITTTDISKSNRGYNLNGAYTNEFGGTSSSTPLAAGIAALVLSVNPNLSREEAGEILRSTADKIDKTGGKYQDGYSIRYGYGRLNAYKAVALAQERASKHSTNGKKSSSVKKNGKPN
jgi:subtilisin family serine protease